LASLSFKPAWLGLLAVVSTAAVLRPAATAVGPVLQELSNSLGIGSTEAGILTAVPGLSFALVGLMAQKIVSKLGPVGALGLSSAAIVLGSLLRVFVSSWIPFLFLTLCALAGMAIGNVVLPAFIRLAFPSAPTRMATIYTTSLGTGALLPSLVADPLTRWGGWQLALGVWTIVAFIAAISWWQVGRKWKTSGGGQVVQQKIPARALLRSSTAIALMIFFGLQSTQAYIQFGWLAQIYRDGGMAASSASLMVAIVSVGGIPGGLIMPRIIRKPKTLLVSIVFFSLLLVVGYGGLALSPLTAPWLWSTCLSISGFCFPTALTLIIERTRAPEVTAALAAFVQPYGYLLAAAGPFLVGVLYSAIGSWPPILWGLACCSVPLFISGFIASKPGLVDNTPAVAKIMRRFDK
jgi:Cyanate permease